MLVNDHASAPTVLGRNDRINLCATCGASVSAAGAYEALRLQAVAERERQRGSLDARYMSSF